MAASLRQSLLGEPYAWRPIWAFGAVGLLAGCVPVFAPHLLVWAVAAALAVVVALLAVTQTDRLLAATPFLVMLAHTSVRHRDPTALLRGILDAQVLFQAGIYATVGFVGLAALNRSGREPVKIAGSNFFILLYVVIAVASVSWASTPIITLPRAAQLAVLYCVAWAAVRRLGHRRFVRAIALSVIVYAVVFSGLALLFPWAGASKLSYGGMTRFSWLAVHPGLAGTYAAIGALFVLSCVLHGPWRSRGPLGAVGLWLLLVFLTTVLFATKARFTAFAYLVGVAILLVTRYTRSRTAFAAALAVAGGLAFVILWIASGLIVAWLDRSMASASHGSWLAGFISRGETLELMRSLTGRRDLWRYALNLILDRPVLGYGYVSSRALLQNADVWGAGESHNAIVEVVLGLGVVGFVVLSFAFGRVMLAALRQAMAGDRDDRAMHAWLFSVLIFLLTHSAVSDSVAGAPGISVLVLLAASVVYSPRLGGTLELRQTRSWRPTAAPGST